MKLLLLTDIPPTTQLTAGLVLDRLIQFMPRGSVCCFAAINPALNLYASVDWMPCEFHDKPIELGTAATGRLDRLCSWVEEEWRQRSVGRKLLKKAIAFARAHQVTAVLGCLQGQTMIRMAAPLARTLRVPLYTLVWDPPEWWIAGHNINARSAKRMLRRFGEAIQASRACAVASWAMADEYQKRYGTFSVPVIASHDRATAKFPPPKLHDPDRLVIGMAGQFYAMEEWNKLISALQLCGWKIAGRDVYLKVLGHWLPSDIPGGRVEFLGWKPQPEAISILSTADLLYCPYPFSDTLEDVSRFSFPSKVVLYLAAGRPVVFHGPAFSSPARYLDERNAGFLVTANRESAIYNALYRAAQDPVAYATVAENGRQAFLEDFTLERMRENFYAFLGTNEHELAASAPRHAGLAMQRVYRARAWELPPRPTLKAVVDAKLAKLARVVEIVRRPLKSIGRHPASPIDVAPGQTSETGARLRMVSDETGWSWVIGQSQAAEEQQRLAIGLMSEPESGAIAGIALRTDGLTRLLVTRAGEVGIGTLTPKYTLHVNGSISGTSYSQTADARLAEDVIPISGAVELVQRLRGVRFLWRFAEDREIGRDLLLPCDDPQLGFVAQEVESVLPEAVSGDGTGVKSVQVPSVVPILVEAIKEQQGQIDDLNRQIAMLETRMAALTFVAGN